MKKPSIIKFKKGKTYSHSTIYDFASVENEFSMQEHGEGVIGEDFLVLKHFDKDITLSFVLVGSNGYEYLYELIYSDLK